MYKFNQIILIIAFCNVFMRALAKSGNIEVNKKLKFTRPGVKVKSMSRLNYKIENRNNFFVSAFGPNFGAIPWEIDFNIFVRILKLRGLRSYAWVFYSQNYKMCCKTYAISTSVIFNFSSVFHSKPYFPNRPQGRHWYQKMWNFLAHLLIHVKSLPHPAPLPKRPRKC